MMEISWIWLLITFCLNSIDCYPFDDDYQTFPSDDCMRCICAASTDCRATARCHITAPNKYMCGPYRLTETYWNVSGRLVPNRIWSSNPLDFEACAHDLKCSMETVKLYIQDNMKRCDSWLEQNWWDDAQLQCRLMALLHYHAIYSSVGGVDYDETIDSHSMPTAIPCNVNITNIGEMVVDLYETSPATRSDDQYWKRYDECAENFIE